MQKKGVFLHTISMDQLKKWFLSRRRSFAWRVNRTPYRVWVAEVMLQQTRAEVVDEYFERWMERFPNVASVAKSSEEEVVKCWEGLGYYSRARNLRLGSQQIMDEFGGVFPSSREELLRIRGIGPYTAGAILCFAFGKAEVAVDANVLRVMCRVGGVWEDPRSTKGQEIIGGLVRKMVGCPQGNVVMESLIELGAQVCGKKPHCGGCPLRNECVAFQEGWVHKLPKKKPLRGVEVLYRSVACIVCQDRVLVQKGKKNDVMEGLYFFPYKDVKGPEENVWKDEDMMEICSFDKVSHSFTRFRAHLYARCYVVEREFVMRGCEWVRKSDLRKLPFCAGHRELVNLLERESIRE